MQQNLIYNRCAISLDFFRSVRSVSPLKRNEDYREAVLFTRLPVRTERYCIPRRVRAILSRRTLVITDTGMRETSLSQSCRGCPCKVLLYDSGVVERPIASILSTRARSVNFLLVTLRYRDIRDTRKGMLKQSLSKRGDEGMRHSCCCCCCPCPRINPVTRKRNFRKKSIR